LAFLVENDETAIREEKRGSWKTAMSPQNLSRFNVDCRERRWPKIAARSVDLIADTNRVCKMNSHQAIGPQLLNTRFVSSAAEF
jgi:hypothetical protein